jgi:hypothetical protein
VDTHAKTQHQRWLDRGPSRTIAAVVVTLLFCGATTAVAAKLITGNDIKSNSIPRGDLKKDVQNAIPIRVSGGLPKKGFSATNDTVKNSPDGVKFGPYADGGTEGGTICTNSMNGQPFSDVKHLAYEAQYTATNNTGGVGVPYLRIFLENDTADAIFSPNTQLPDPDFAQGPFHTWVATAGSWRYDDDTGTGPDSPFKTIQNDHADETISGICISVGNSAGTNLSALLRTWEVNTKDYAFGQ